MAHTFSPSPWPSELETALSAQSLGRPCFYFSEIDSTNTWLRRPEQAGLPAGTLVVADYQRQGKGRLGRQWVAPPETSLLFSLLLRPGWPLHQAHWLTMLAGSAVVAAIQAAVGAGLRVALKWPNDIVIESTAESWRKCGGILLETEIEAERLQMAVMGIGLNVNVSAENLPAASPLLPATSLLAETGLITPRWPLLGAILEHLAQGIAEAEQGHSPQPAWNRQLMTLGRVVTVNQVTEQAAPLTGIAEATDAWGALIVRDAHGQRHTIMAGDVTLRSAETMD